MKGLINFCYSFFMNKFNHKLIYYYKKSKLLFEQYLVSMISVVCALFVLKISSKDVKEAALNEKYGIQSFPSYIQQTMLSLVRQLKKILQLKNLKKYITLKFISAYFIIYFIIKKHLLIFIFCFNKHFMGKRECVVFVCPLILNF